MTGAESNDLSSRSSETWIAERPGSSAQVGWHAIKGARPGRALPSSAEEPLARLQRGRFRKPSRSTDRDQRGDRRRDAGDQVQRQHKPQKQGHPLHIATIKLFQPYAICGLPVERCHRDSSLPENKNNLLWHSLSVRPVKLRFPLFVGFITPCRLCQCFGVADWADLVFHK